MGETSKKKVFEYSGFKIEQGVITDGTSLKWYYTFQEVSGSNCQVYKETGRTAATAFLRLYCLLFDYMGERGVSFLQKHVISQTDTALHEALKTNAGS